MSVPVKRLYIRKLPDFINKSEIESKFGHYGKVVSVEIISRKNDGRENQEPFAYVNLETSDDELFRCVRDFANRKWKGEFVDVQVAKESFLSRLQKEREEEKSKKQGGDEKWKRQSAGEDFTSNGRGKKLYFDEGLNVEVKKESNKRKKIYFGEEGENVKEEIIENSLENSLLLNGSRVVDSITNIVQKDPKHIEADKKRKSSNIEMRNQFRQQKLQIRSALSNLDGKATNKKIIFDENAFVTPVATNERKNKQLFDDEDSEDDEDMNVPSKPQFEGKEGHKLFQLQSRFKNDKRFVMNEKFLEADHVEENENEVPKDERETQLNILEQVLGKKVTVKANDVKQKPKAMLRFNPDDPQHKAYELQHQGEEKPPTKKKKRKEAPETTTDEAKPEVSKSKFYKVADDLKNVFQTENKSFSLLAGRKDDEIETQEENQVEMREISKKPIMDFNGAFNNLTSDEEEIEEATTSQQQQQQQQQETTKSASDRVRFWSEPFFFQEDDFRYQEGVDFIKRLGCQENGDFLELRRNVKEVVRAKVKNVNRKKGMFKKKLGGVKKRMKMKRALKR